ncbi:hypothetical protein ES703_72656 [subsurface metagenome]
MVFKKVLLPLLPAPYKKNKTCALVSPHMLYPAALCRYSCSSVSLSVILAKNFCHNGHCASGLYSTGDILVIRSFLSCAFSSPVCRLIVPFLQLNSHGFESSSSSSIAISGSDMDKSTIAALRSFFSEPAACFNIAFLFSSSASLAASV